VELLEESVATDPGYAPAWSALAYNLLWLAGSGANDNQEMQSMINRSEEAVESALRIDPDSPSAIFARGVKSIFYNRDVKGGRIDWERAYELEPGSALTTASMGNISRICGQLDRALLYLKEAIVLDPLEVEIYNILGITHYARGEYEDAINAFEKTLQLSGDFTGANSRMARAYLASGKLERAIEAATEEPEGVYKYLAQGMAYHDLGDASMSEDALQSLIGEYKMVAAYQVAELYAYRGQSDLAFQWLDRAIAQDDSGVLSALGNRAFNGLINDPRWPDFLQQVGLYEYWLQMPPEWGGPRS
jgi:tetratricopeptide (TPR) repeat protein